MKRRIGNAENTHLGGNSAVLLDDTNTSNVSDKTIRAFSKDVYKTFFKGTTLDYDIVDTGATESYVKSGIEPSYQFDPLKLITVDKKKDYSSIVTGRAVGAWASAIISTTKYYKDYKKSSKFPRFVDKWHPILFATPKDNQ